MADLRNDSDVNPRTSKLALALPVVAAGLLAAEAAQAFRCGNKIVRDGMHEFEVIAICGEPTSMRYIGHALRGYDYDWRTGNDRYAYYRYPGWSNFATEVAITEFVYNFGPRKLMRRLVFQGGVLVTIETLGYGYREE